MACSCVGGNVKILYGVQATGNGHITRARVMAPALKAAGLDVDYVFSGRPADALFDMEPFGDYRVFRGMTFHMGEGAKVRPWTTLMNNSLIQLVKEIRSLDLGGYDLVLTDFEPVTAWAAKLQRVKSVGLAHQYAFMHKLPDKGLSLLLRPGVSIFAPVSIPIGVHWDHFNRDIIPPLISPPRFDRTLNEKEILVYLPFERDETLIRWFSGFPDYSFHVFTKCNEAHRIKNVHFHPLSRDRFEQTLAQCDGVISNCGFGLASEAMQYGKRFLTKPMKGQSEQRSNAILLESLKRATVIDEWNRAHVAEWLATPNPEPLSFSGVAEHVADWIARGAEKPVRPMVNQSWGSV
jgi:uncharacterized protein (TIGR00661 family)